MVNAKKPLSLVLALLMALSAFFVLGTTTMLGASAATGDTIYFEKPDSWNEVFCHAWVKSTNTPVGSWPGTPMTLVSGNIYSFTLPGNQDGIIFNNGNDQTENLDFSGANKIFKPSKTSGKDITGTWSDYEGPTNPSTPTSPDDPTDPVKPTDPNPDGAAYAYLNNEAGWATPHVYYWKTKGVENKGWPGVALTDANKNSDGYYEVIIPANYIDKVNGGVIFHNNTNDSEKSADLKIGAGESMVYNNKTKSWETYDAGDLKIRDFGTSEKSPQYKDTQITIYADAYEVNGATVEYEFTVSGAENKTLQEYSENSSVVWIPSKAGEYKLTVNVRAGKEINTRTMDYTIKDDATEARPVLKGITPTAGSTIKTGEHATVSVNASGGQVGTNLLFYKVAITQQSTQEVVNDEPVYYSLKKDYAFTPTQDGTYTVTVSVQNSSNATVTKSFDVFASGSGADLVVSSLRASQTSNVNCGESVEITAAANGGSQPYQYQFTADGSVAQSYSSSGKYTYTPQTPGSHNITVTVKDSKGATASRSITITAVKPDDDVIMGDVTGDGEVTLVDAVMVQKASIQIVKFDSRKTKAADMNQSGDVTLEDALLVQKKALSYV